jgi:hypothetical protein
MIDPHEQYQVMVANELRAKGLVNVRRYAGPNAPNWGLSAEITPDRELILRVRNDVVNVHVTQMEVPSWFDPIVGTYFAVMMLLPVIPDLSFGIVISAWSMALVITLVGIAARRPRVVRTVRQKLSLKDSSSVPLQCLDLAQEVLKDEHLPVPVPKRARR